MVSFTGVAVGASKRPRIGRLVLTLLELAGGPGDVEGVLADPLGEASS